MSNPALSMVFLGRPSDFYDVAMSYIESETKNLGIEPSEENKNKLAEIIKLFGCVVISDREKILAETDERRLYLQALLDYMLYKIQSEVSRT